MDRRRDPAAVQEQDRLAAALRERAQLGEQRRRERIAGLAAQVDDRGRAGAGPASRPPSSSRSRRAQLSGRGVARAEDRNRALERRALRRHRPRVVARIRLLLVRRVVLLVDADDADPIERGEDRRAGADDDRSVAACDPLPLVAALGLGERRVEDGDAVAEAGAEAADRLRRERDLRDEHDRAASPLERGRARLDVDLGLAAAGRAVEQEVAAAARPAPRGCGRSALACDS